MPPLLLKLTRIVLLIPAILLTLIGLKIMADGHWPGALAIVGGIAFLALSQALRRIDPAWQARWAGEKDAELERIRSGVLGAGQDFSFRSQPLFLICCLFACALLPLDGLLARSLFLNPGQPALWFIALALLALSWLFLMATLRNFPLMQRPEIRFSLKGVDDPAFGLIPWSAVQGIHLRVLQTRRYFYLGLYIPDLPQRQAGMHPLIRRLFRLPGFLWQRDRIVFTLRDRQGREAPEVIEAAARMLWEKATGRSHAWKQNLPASESQALARLTQAAVETEAEIRARMQRNGYEAMIRESEEKQRDIELLLRRRQQRLWLGLIPLAAVLLWAGFAVLRHF